MAEGLHIKEEYAEAMPDMSREEYRALKESIREHGIEVPLKVDIDNAVIDGHHRLRAWRELGRDEDEIPTELDPADDALEKAVRTNLARRNLSNGSKKEAVKRYLERYWDGERDQKEVAADLGVSPGTVTNATKELEESGKQFKFKSLSKSERKKQVRAYLDDHPDASNREVADAVECDVSHVTVGNWKKELEAEYDTTQVAEATDGGSAVEETAPPGIFTTNATEREAAREVVSQAKAGDETAQEEVTKIAAGAKPATSAKRTVEQKQRTETTETPDLPDGVYSVLYADPPWQYDFAETSNRAIENQYGTMSLSEIKGLDVPSADDAVLYLWTTAPKLEEGLDVLRAWGFEYVTNAVWDKQKIGMGYWFRGQHELLLVGKRGSFSPPESDARVSSVISAPRSEHSAKPEAVRELIEDAFPEEPKLELFARVKRDGWDSWGDEA